MGIAERKEREREEMRGRILQAAAELFVRDGFEKTTIRSIAQYIEYSPGTIYLYFRDKEEIKTALFVVLFGKFSKKLQEAGFGSSLHEAMATIGHKYMEFAMENPMQYELMFLIPHGTNANGEECHPDDPIEKAGGEAFDYLKQTLMTMESAGRTMRYDLDTATLTAWASVHGIAALYLRGFMGKFPADRIKEMVYKAVESMQHAIFKN